MVFYSFFDLINYFKLIVVLLGFLINNQMVYL